MRILDRFAKVFGLNANPPTTIIPPNVDLGYQKRINCDGSVGGLVHSFAVVHPNAIVYPNSQVDPYVHIVSGQVTSGTLVTIQNHQVIETPLP